MTSTLGIYALDSAGMVALAGAVSRLGVRDQDRYLVPRAALLSMFFVANAGAMLWLDCTVVTLFFIGLQGGVASVAFSKPMQQALELAFRDSRLVLFAITVFTVSTLTLIHLPIATYLSSPDEFTLGLERVLARNGQDAMTAVYVAALTYGIAPSSPMRSSLTFLALLSLGLSLVYSLVYPFGYPPMNGFVFEQIPIETAAMVLRIVVDIVTVGALAAGVVVAVKKLGPKRLSMAIVLLNVVLIGASVIRLLLNEEDVTRPPVRASASDASERPLRFAAGKDNILVIFLDRFMGGFVEPILEQAPDLATRLDGFTWYPRTVAAGENTIAGFHPLLGGYDYTPRELSKRHEPLRETTAESYAILPWNFTQKGYGTNLINPRGLGYTFDGNCQFIPIAGRCTHIPESVPRRIAQQYGLSEPRLPDAGSAELLAFLGAMRVAPYGLREVINLRSPPTIAVDHVAGITFKEWAELKALPTLTATDADRSQLNVLLNILPHEPYFIDLKCMPRPQMPTITPAEVGLPADAHTYEVQHFLVAKCALSLLAEYFQWMREAGVYDSTKIVVVSDHGINGPVRDRSSRAVAGGTTANEYVRSRSLLLVKERNAHGAMAASEQFLPNAEVPRILCEDIGGCVNPYLGNAPIEAHGRNLPFVVTTTPFQYSLQKNAFIVRAEKELIAPDPYARENWRAVR